MAGPSAADTEMSNGKKLPKHLEEAHSYATVLEKRLRNPTGKYGAHAYAAQGVKNNLDIEDFRRSLVAKVTRNDQETLHFELKGIDAPIANALRRVLLAEVPTMAIEKVYIKNNSSVMHDEMLAHRLGLVPLAIDARPFSFWKEGDEFHGRNSVKFKLVVTCKHASRRDSQSRAHAAPSVLYENSSVLSANLEYVPTPGNEHIIPVGSKPGPVHDKIVLTKLRPGQQIDIECIATKGIGKEHAKWSPVATAFYSMLPVVRMKRTMRGDDARRLVDLCPVKVFDIEDDTAVVANARKCTMCRECIRGEERAGDVELLRRRDHFLFEVENTGSMHASLLVVEALKILGKKCDTLEGQLMAAKRRKWSESDAAEENGVAPMEE